MIESAQVRIERIRQARLLQSAQAALSALGHPANPAARATKFMAIAIDKVCTHFKLTDAAVLTQENRAFLCRKVRLQVASVDLSDLTDQQLIETCFVSFPIFGSIAEVERDAPYGMPVSVEVAEDCLAILEIMGVEDVMDWNAEAALEDQLGTVAEICTGYLEIAQIYLDVLGRSNFAETGAMEQAVAWVAGIKHWLDNTDTRPSFVCRSEKDM